MIARTENRARILIVEDVEETREAIQELLKRDGYLVDPAKDEDEAIERAQRNHPCLILISLDGKPEELEATAQRIRRRSGLTQQTPVVIFSLAALPEGAEKELAGNIHVTAPDSFDQLRTLLRRTLRGTFRTH